MSFREVSITYIAGTINRDEMFTFKKFIYRASRGKVLTHFEDPEVVLKDFQGNPLDKIVYVLVFQEGNHFKERI